MCMEKKMAIGKGPLTRGPTAARTETQNAYYTHGGGMQKEEYAIMIAEAEELGFAKGQAAMKVVQQEGPRNVVEEKEGKGVDGSYFAGQYAAHD